MMDSLYAYHPRYDDIVGVSMGMLIVISEPQVIVSPNENAVKMMFFSMRNVCFYRVFIRNDVAS